MIIGITGIKGSGKDTAAAYLVEKYGFQRHAFADKLKDAVAALFDIDRDEVDKLKGGTEGDGAIPFCEVLLQEPSYEKSFTWREFLQRFGTEMGRGVFGEDFWTEQLFMHSLWTLEHVVISDVRFENEAKAIARRNGRIIEIQRPELERDSHISEAGLPHELIEYTILNSETIKHLHDCLDDIMADMGITIVTHS